jgi:type IV pilus assembly protein PilW
MIKKQQGFTLLEIFISLVIGLVIIGGTLSVFVGMKSTTTETSSMGELQENGRFAVSLLTDDLLRQNFWGDYVGDLSFVTLLSNPVAPVTDCVGGGVNNASFHSGIGNFRTLWATAVVAPTILGGCITNAASNSDVIQIKRAIAVPVAANALNNNRYYIQSNSNKANIFAGDAAVAALENSRIWEYQHHIYYVREESIGNSGQIVPVLVQGRLQNAATPIGFNMLVEGIERIHYMFGVDTDEDGVVNAYMSSNDMSENAWDNNNGIRILAVKLYVLVRSIRADVKYTNDNVYNMGDIQFDANGDNFRRLLFSSTVSLHNARIKLW